MDKNAERKPAMSDEDLDQVVGGASMNVNNAKGVVVRSEPRSGSQSAGLLQNGDVVNTTGETVSDGWDTWYEIYYPCHGWIKSSSLK
jgi:hypothetical protein